MIVQRDIPAIINTLIENGIIAQGTQVKGMLKGTTDGQVYNLEVCGETQYVLKADHPESLSSVHRLHQMYADSPLLAKLIFTDPAQNYILYTYIQGTTHVERGSKIEWLTLLVNNLLNHYQIIPDEKWGGVERLHDTWEAFNALSLAEARLGTGNVLPEEDYRMVEALAGEIAGVQTKYLLHGDTGVHNFVFRENRLAGIIDPSPMAGPLIYDFTYAFCSSPDELNLETLFAAFEQLKPAGVDRSRLIREVTFQLYCRIGICARVHPQDLEEYLMAWEAWKLHLV